MRTRIFFIFLFCNILLPHQSLLASAPEEVPSSVQNQQPVQEQPQKSNGEQKTTIIQFYTWSAMLPNQLINLQSDLSAEQSSTLQNKVFPEITADARDLQWDVTMALSTPNPQKYMVDNFQFRFSRLQNQIAKIEKPLTDSITRLSTWRNDWYKKKEQLKDFSEMPTLSLAMAIEEQQKLRQVIDEAIKIIENQLAPTLAMGKEVANFQVRLHTILNELQKLNAAVLKTSTQKTAPSILSAKFYRQINANLFIDTYSNSKQFLLQHLASLKNIWDLALAGCFVFAIFCIVIYRSRHFVAASSRWYPFASCPLATGVFIVTSSYKILNKQIYNNFGEQWDQILTILSLIAVYRLVRYLVDEKWKIMLFSRLAFFMVIFMVIATLQLPQFLMLLFVVGASFAALMIYIYQLHIKCQSNWQLFARRSWGILPILIILASLTGYDQFALVAFTTLMTSFAVVLIVWMLYHLNSAFLELVLKITPFALLRENMSVIVKSLQPFIAIGHITIVIGLLAVIWDISPSLNASLQDLTALGFDFGGFHVSPGVLLTIFAVLYGTTLISKAIQAVLLKEILPHYKAEKGVQLSITRLVHYAILTIGFLVMLNFLGFDIKQLTLLGGALGVGIGFGLQAIVNNFVSGLILLFERPIKVGDTIQVGTELGEVRKLGLRATIIQTFDNAEIVVPNADLVTGQVTNWTLGERKVRVRIPVGVAYGTDVSKVLEILKACADTHPMVLNTPTPIALFLAFGASSLDFELRAWIPEFLDKTIAISELNQSIESEFAINNIEVPFLQTDLHIRSVDAAAAMALSGKQFTQNADKYEGDPAKDMPGGKTEKPQEAPA